MKETIESWCNGCQYEGEGFKDRVGSDIHADGLLIDEDALDSEWSRCPVCGHLSAH